MKYKKEPRSKNVEDETIKAPISTIEGKESRKDRQFSTPYKEDRKDMIFRSPEFKKALNDIAVEYNKKIGSGKGNRVVKK